MSKIFGCLAAVTMCVSVFAAAPQMQDNPQATDGDAAQIPVSPYNGILRTHASDFTPAATTAGGPVATGIDVLGPLFGGTIFSMSPQDPGGTIWTRVRFLNDGTVDALVRNPEDETLLLFAPATNVNWVDDFGYDTYFAVRIEFTDDGGGGGGITVFVNDVELTLEVPATGTPVPFPHPILGAGTSTLDLLGFESNNALLPTSAFIDDISVVVGGTIVLDNGLEPADGVEKGPLDEQPAGPLDAGMPTTLWEVAADAPITFVSGNAPLSGDASIELRRDGANGFGFTAVAAQIDEALAGPADTTIIANWRIGNGRDGTATDIGGPTVSCRQVGTVADPDDVGETCCEFEWTYDNTTTDFTLLGGFIALEAGNGGPCSNTEAAQIDDDIDFFFGDIDFCRGDVGGAGWSLQGGNNNRTVLDLGGLDLEGGEQATGRIRVKAHAGAAIALPDGTSIEDGQILAAASIFSPNAFGGPDPDMPEGLDCQSQFGPHLNTVYDVLWFDTAVWQWMPLLPVPALSFGGKMMLLAGVGLVGVILIARSRKTATA